MNSAPRVLVVDDERFFREAVRDALDGLPLRCELAESGEEALKLGEDPRVQAVLLDVRLPGLSGVELLRALRDRRPALRVIVLAAPSDQELVLEALRLGAADYLAKPLHEEELRLAVTRALAGTRLASRFESLCARLDALVEAGDALVGLFGEAAAGEPLDALAEPGVRLLTEVLSCQRTSLLRAEPDGLRVAAIAGSELSAQELPPADPAESVSGLVLDAGRLLRFDDIDRDERCAGRVRRGRYATRAALLAPLQLADGAAGVLCAADPQAGGFGDEDEALLRLFAERLSGLLSGGSAASGDREEAVEAGGAEDALLADPDERLRADLLRAACEAMTDEVEPEAVLAAALAPVAVELSAATAIYTLDARAGGLALEARSDAGARSDRPRLPRDRGLSALVLQTGRMVATGAPQDDARFDAEVDTPEDGEPGPLLLLPLSVRGKVLGLARIHPDDPDAASPRTGELIAAGLSAALRNALLYRSLVEAIDDVARARREVGKRGPG